MVVVSLVVGAAVFLIGLILGHLIGQPLSDYIFGTIVVVSFSYIIGRQYAPYLKGK